MAPGTDDDDAGGDDDTDDGVDDVYLQVQVSLHYHSALMGLL